MKTIQLWVDHPGKYKANEAGTLPRAWTRADKWEGRLVDVSDVRDSDDARRVYTVYEQAEKLGLAGINDALLAKEIGDAEAGALMRSLAQVKVVSRGA